MAEGYHLCIIYPCPGQALGEGGGGGSILDAQLNSLTANLRLVNSFSGFYFCREELSHCLCVIQYVSSYMLSHCAFISYVAPL